mmetsp:Transcript_16826/g.31872  ORF Transcript_16826/g.31872 Transcript_16826/m.31872 type:complete len:215 (+) Transcript_16826:1029-1673(+)
MSSNILTSHRLITINTPKKIIMSQRLRLGQLVTEYTQRTRQLRLFTPIFRLQRLRIQINHKIILLFTLTNRNFRINRIPKSIQERISLRGNLGQFLGKSLDFFLHGLHLLDFFLTGLLGLFLGSNDVFLKSIDVGTHFIESFGFHAPFFVFGNDLIDPMGGFEAGRLILAPFGGVSSFVVTKFVNVNGHGVILRYEFCLFVLLVSFCSMNYIYL